MSSNHKFSRRIEARGSTNRSLPAAGSLIMQALSERVFAVLKWDLLMLAYARLIDIMFYNLIGKRSFTAVYTANKTTNLTLCRHLIHWYRYQRFAFRMKLRLCCYLYRSTFLNMLSLKTQEVVLSQKDEIQANPCTNHQPHARVATLLTASVDTSGAVPSSICMKLCQ